MTQSASTKYQWRGAPGLVTPYRQWIRDYLPSAKDGFVFCGDDGFARRWTPERPYGGVRPVEVKTWLRKQIDVPTKLSFHCLLNGRVGDPLILNLVGGNVPSELLSEYPPPCADCGLPEQPVVAEAIYLNNRLVSVDELVSEMLDLDGYRMEGR